VNATRFSPVVVIGGSAGAIEPLRRVISSLPADLPAAVAVVVHLPAARRSMLPTLLRRVGVLPVGFAVDGSPLSEGVITVAPPGQHLLVHDGRVSLSRGARVNGSRPAIDPLFRSAVAARGAAVVSVVLSGTLDDGAAGTAVVHNAGGRTIVQEPGDAEFPDMPANAIATGGVDHVVTAEEIGPLVARLVHELWAEPAGVRHETDRASASGTTVDRALKGRAEDLEGAGSPYSCPDCGGVLYEREQPTEYLCRLGHRLSPESLAHRQTVAVEDALWTALRTLDEATSLAERIRDRARARGDDAVARRFDARMASSQARADRIRAVLREPDEDEVERSERDA
jgi:two-component system chemotaxis response regulator CheB